MATDLKQDHKKMFKYNSKWSLNTEFKIGNKYTKRIHKTTEIEFITSNILSSEVVILGIALTIAAIIQFSAAVLN